MNKNRKNRGRKIVILIIFLMICVSVGYVYTSPEFEQEAPQIKSASNIFWNRKAPLSIELSDNRALKSYELSLSDGRNSVILDQVLFDEVTQNFLLQVNYPKNSILDRKAKALQLKIVVHDRSYWQFLNGNKAEKIIDIKIDYKRPSVSILANSYSMTQGGAGLVVFQALDDNLEEVFIQAGGQKFQVQPYKEEGYYAGLIGWPFNQKDFSAKIIAKDSAGNQRVSDIPFYLKNKNYKVSWIKVRDKFIDGKITDLAQNSEAYADIEDRLEKFKAINESMRLNNEALIHSLSMNLSLDILEEWKIKRFYPLRNGAKVASYGDERHYYYKERKNEVSHSYHVGYDLASTRMADIKSSNKGVVVFADENGIYGNMPMIDHGLGLYTLYGHCSSIKVAVGDEVEAGSVIAKTGKTGLALGDHLHFGMVIQGVEVRPVEWFDASWIRKNIDNIFKEANKIIKGS